ncbi:MAG: hypothetical protein RSF67_05330, partial [Clostridia bacterium]
EKYNSIKEMYMYIQQIKTGEYNSTNLEYVKVLEFLNTLNIDVNSTMINFKPIYWEKSLSNSLTSKPKVDESDVLDIFIFKNRKDKGSYEQMLKQHDSILALSQIKELVYKKIEKYNIFGIILNKISKTENDDIICIKLYFSYMGN